MRYNDKGTGRLEPRRERYLKQQIKLYREIYATTLRHGDFQDFRREFVRRYEIPPCKMPATSMIGRVLENAYRRIKDYYRLCANEAFSRAAEDDLFDHAAELDEEARLALVKAQKISNEIHATLFCDEPDYDSL